MKVDNVVVVGGECSGWIVAATIAKLCKHIKITVIETDIKTVVGSAESSIPYFRRLFYMLGIEDKEWMPFCNATYKNADKFTNYKANESFQIPFIYDLDYSDKPSGINALSELAMFFPKEFGSESFAEFYATSNSLMTKHNKQTYNHDNKLKIFNFKYDTAFHFDLNALGEWMKHNVAIPNGVEVINCNVKSPVFKDNGELKEIVLYDGETVSADLFVDCTGYNAILLEKWMGGIYEDFHDCLAIDSALVADIPYIDRETELKNYTEYTGMKNGASWVIPLWDNLSVGYNFSSKFCTQEEAETEFREHLSKTNKDRADKAEFKHFRIRNGYHKKPWIRNVVAIGLSFGFVEPMELSGLITTYDTLIKLVDTLNRRNGYLTRTEVDAYNFSCVNALLKNKEFSSMFYALSDRTDTPFWHWCTQEIDYFKESFSNYYTIQNQYPGVMDMIVTARKYAYAFQNNLFVAAGMGVKSISTPELMLYNDFNNSRDPMAKIEEITYTKRTYNKYKTEVEEYVITLLSSYQFLKETIYKQEDYNDNAL